MTPQNKTKEMNLGGRKLIVRTGHVARQANGAVTLQYGDTLILVTACGTTKAKPGQDFFPLTVEYQEKTYAGGTIPGGFFKREGKATEKEVLTARLTDRPIRPLFPEGYINEVQIVAQVFSSDGENDPDIHAINGASLALLLSEIPFLEPVGAVRVGEVNGQFVVNPTYAQLKDATLEIIVAGTKDGITMIESGAKEISDERIIEALEFGHKAVKELIAFQNDFAKGIAKDKWKVEPAKKNHKLIDEVKKMAVPAFKKINQPKRKEQREEEISKLTNDLIEMLVREGGPVADVSAEDVAQVVHDIEYDEVRKHILGEKKRVDGRKFDEIRPITVETSVLPRTHGSAIFTRGQTQALGVVTLGTGNDEQTIESYEGRQTRRFMLHYNFPPFSVGEVKMMRGPGRREVGHGALAWRGLEAVLPPADKFPYVIRIVSEILESNGSSSMATVCAGSLAMMDAGVPIKAPVSGIAMGLVMEGSDWAVLSDIAGVEDHLGDMDFKVAGTAKGITTLQLDIKLKEGIRMDVLRKALQQANQGRAHILSKMNEVLSSHRATTSAYAPRITTIKVSVDKIREIIGPGGKMIRKITADSGASVNIEDDGTVTIASNREDATRKAIDMIHEIAQEAEVGRIYNATVKRIMAFGAFCEFMPGREGLVHVSELSSKFTAKVEDVVKIGDQFKVLVKEIDQQGRVNLSRKQAMSPEERAAEAGTGGNAGGGAGGEGKVENSKSAYNQRGGR